MDDRNRNSRIGSRGPAGKAKPKRRGRAPKKPDKEIIYTPPQPFNRRRFLFGLAMVVAVVLAVFMTVSLFFKVKVNHKERGDDKLTTTITVTGNKKYSATAIVDASGIQDGDSLLTLNDARISSRIITNLPYVKSVRIGIKLPDTVNIEIEELDVVYAIEDNSGSWWLLAADGRVVEKTDGAGATEHTKLLGVRANAPTPGKTVTAYEPPPATTEEGETVPVSVTAAERLRIALSIALELEKNGVMGQMLSIDVTNVGGLEMWYGQRFRILLGDSNDLPNKVYMAVTAANQLADYDRGVLDASFTERTEVIYTPESN